MKRKAKFHVGQVVNWNGHYRRVTLAYIVSEGVGRGLRWCYKILRSSQVDTDNVSEHELRPLTQREAGR